MLNNQLKNNRATYTLSGHAKGSNFYWTLNNVAPTRREGAKGRTMFSMYAGNRVLHLHIFFTWDQAATWKSAL
jgi:hypothetical protein